VIHLNEGAKANIVAKFQQLQAMSMGQFAGMIPLPPHMGQPPPPPGRQSAPAPPGGKHAFFNQLPQDKLLPKELALREALVNWVNNWPELRPPTRPEDSPPHLSDSGQDEEITRCRKDLLPNKVKLVDWIELRIGGEIELKSVAHGQHEVYLRGAGGRKNNGDAGQSAVTAAERHEQKQEAKERFFSNLPEGEFSPEEESLRVALIEFIDSWTGATSPSINDCSTDETVKTARAALLPSNLVPVGASR